MYDLFCNLLATNAYGCRAPIDRAVLQYYARDLVLSFSYKHQDAEAG